LPVYLPLEFTTVVNAFQHVRNPRRTFYVP